MKLTHAPRVNLRYWTAITLCSVFGTNMGDFYAHKSGMGLLGGLWLLAALTAIVFLIERFENLRHEAYYWLVIVIIRTGATNIADYMAGRRGAHLPEPWLSLGWIAFIAIFGFFTHSAKSRGDKSAGALPSTAAPYWFAMLGCGVFGTVFGDVCSDWWGQGVASLILLTLQIILLALVWKRVTSLMAIYWTTVALCRTTGTAIGDFLAESKTVDLGGHASALLNRFSGTASNAALAGGQARELGWLISAIISGVVFVLVLLLWKGSTKGVAVSAEAVPAEAEA